MDPALPASVPELEFFAPAPLARKVRAARERATGAERARLTVYLAWYQRHRDWREARRLADEAEPLAAGLPPDRVLLPLANLRAAELAASDPAGATERLRQALAVPLADRILHPHIGAARVLLGRCELAAGRPGEARQAVQGLRYSVALESAALAVRLGADALEGRDDPALRAEAVALVDSGRVPPLHALDLMRALVPARKRDAAGWQRRMQAAAQAVADSLRDLPSLQAALIRKHRDLLT